MPANKSKKILVVEDSLPLHEFYTRLFNKEGYEVDVAENGRLGFRKGVTFDYDLIVCDLHMPEWNGVEAIKSILMVKPDTRFVVVTGYADKKITDELDGIDELLGIFSKPVDINQLVNCLNKL